MQIDVDKQKVVHKGKNNASVADRVINSELAVQERDLGLR